MIKPLSSAEVAEVTNIHIKSLKGDFLPSLGFNFLKTFYQGVVGKPGVFGFGVFEDNKLRGFVVGTDDSSNFFSLAMRSNFIRLLFLLTVAVIKKPLIVKNIFETFFYTNKAAGAKAELVVIAVDKGYRKKGSGKKLIKSIEETFLKSKIEQYKLTVHADKAAVGFYEHLGYVRVSSFNLYGKMWYVYEKKLPKNYTS